MTRHAGDGDPFLVQEFGGGCGNLHGTISS
jgi:hypothetical protein